MISIKNKYAQKNMIEAGRLLAEVFFDLQSYIKPGMTTFSIDLWIGRQLKNKNLMSAMRGYMGYKYVSCISINDEVVHGIPHEARYIQPDDLVKVDVCASWNGYCADMARCFYFGNDEHVKKLIDVAMSSLDHGIAKSISTNHLSDISAAIQLTVEQYGFGVVRDFAGHGIGKKMHEDPEILNYGAPGKGPLIQNGMAFALEPMITLGNYEVFVMDDGWTVKTVDKSFAAHVEDTVLITEHGPSVITRL
ncbi:MAG: type I methionyl aminopeptidase [Candidatus Babeliaceae bacterium]|jgi:methionyl aminopeptidase